MSAPRIRFVVSGGARQGLGHVMRCAVIAGEAMRRGHRVSFALRGDSAAARALEAELPRGAVSSWTGATDAVADADGVVLDTPEPIGAELAAARALGVRTVVLDRIDALDQADATVLPVLHAPETHHPRVRRGALWCVLAPAVRAHRAAPYPGERRVALVTLGGADPRGLTGPIAEVLGGALAGLRAGGSAIEGHCVIGPAFAEPNQVIAQVRAAGLQVHRSLTRDELAALMARSLFALAGFGTSVYDLAALGVPALYWAHYATDLTGARRLEGLGLGAAAGFAGDFTRDRCRAALEQTVLRAEWRTSASARGIQLLAEANGAARIVELVVGVRVPERIAG
jgi:UDP-2,4-diacetamido-2,4,6-trideoxy-beta-L-altropyranose hydrolase